MSKILLPIVNCKNSEAHRSAILLPYPSPPQILEGPPLWPMSDWRATAACHECAHVFSYSAEDVRWEVFPTDFLNRLRARPHFFRIEIECAGTSCEFPLVVHAYTGETKTIDDIERFLVVGEMTCLAGHQKKRPEYSQNVKEESGPIE